MVIAESRATRELCTVAALQHTVAAVKRAVAAKHGISIAVVVVVAPGTLPKTTSGKLKRLAIRAMFMGGKLDVVYSSSLALLQRGQVRTGDDVTLGPAHARVGNGALPDEADLSGRQPAIPATETEQWVLDCLSTHCNAHGAGPRSSLAALGIDSIQIQLLLSTIERDLQVKLGPTDLAQCDTISRLADVIDARRTNSSAAVASRAEQAIEGLLIVVVALACTYSMWLRDDISYLDQSDAHFVEENGVVDGWLLGRKKALSSASTWPTLTLPRLAL